MERHTDSFLLSVEEQQSFYANLLKSQLKFQILLQESLNSLAHHRETEAI